MYWNKQTIDVASAVIHKGETARDKSVDQRRFAEEAERWLDHWYGGAAQIARLKKHMMSRFGTDEEPRGEDPLEPNLASEDVVNDDGRALVENATELATVRLVKCLADDLGCLYDSDDFERIYKRPDGSKDENAEKVLGYYHAPDHGCLKAALVLLDAWLTGLRSVGLLVTFEEDTGELEYDVLPPHWFVYLTRPDKPNDPRLAYAVAYSEPDSVDENGKPVPSPTWTCYVRPALASDPLDAPTRLPGFERTGRLVRFRRPGALLDQNPWPIPDPDSELILPDFDTDTGKADGPNPIAVAGGFDALNKTRRVWSPIVLYSAEKFVSGLRLPIAVDQAQLGEELDFGLTSALHTANLQSNGILVKTGPGKLPDRIGPSHPIELSDANGKAEFIAPPGMAEVHIGALRRVAQIAGTLQHLPPDHYSDTPPSIETGPAKQLRRAELIAARARRTVAAERPESDLFALERALHNAHGKTSDRPLIAWDTRVSVHWGELATPADWGQRLTQMGQELELGLSDMIDLMMERHGIDRAEAKRRLEDRTKGAPIVPVPSTPGAKPATTPTTPTVGASGAVPPGVEGGVPAPTGGATSDGLAVKPDVALNAVPPDSALAGAQTTAAIDIVIKVAERKIPRNSGVNALTAFFALTREKAEAIMDEVGRTFFAPTPAPPPVPTFGKKQPGMPAASDQPEESTTPGPSKAPGDEDKAV